MPKNLVVVESPAKAKTINRYLGKDYIVKASMGHVRDLPPKKLGVDVENNFEPEYELLKDRDKAVAELKKAARGVDNVYLATDPDREGEAIGWHVAHVLKNKKRKFYRVTFHEITKTAILKAFENPGQLNTNKIDAQQTRRILDRLVGYKVSPLLWKLVRRGLSAGRVQSVALRMIVEREREREAFKVEEYWTLHAHLEGKKKPAFEALGSKHKGKKLKIANEKAAGKIIKSLDGESFEVTSLTKRKRTKAPYAPFITSQLQQESSKRLGMTVKRTMRVAQSLYEGKAIGKEGTVGLITYMRTDSTHISSGAMAQLRDYIGSEYGKDYLSPSPRAYKTKKSAQEAHEAIRPTDVTNTPQSIAKHLDKDELRLYTLIWNRFVASQMNDALYDSSKAEICAGDYMFRADGSILRFDGFLKVYTMASATDDKLLPELKKGDVLKLNKLDPKQHFTQPPARFTEATLVKAMEENGIGRPSTYASIIGTIESRLYVEKEEKKFAPTELGCLVSDIVTEQFSDIMAIDYTARMEETLDAIEEGKMNWVKALKEFYKKFDADLKKANKNAKPVVEETKEKCELCKSKMIIRWGRFGKFMACSNYPECKNTKELAGTGEKIAAPPAEGLSCEKCGKEMVLKSGRFGKFYACSGYPDCKSTVPLKKSGGGAQAAPPKELDEKCPKCKKNMVVREGRFGEFTACSGYPKCKYIKPKLTGVKCPEKDCGGDIAERGSKRGAFYGCTNYPDCDYTSRHMPIKEKCPDCKLPFILTKETKKDGKQKFCSDKECGYKAEWKD